jgi:2-oxoisovalerate dehydrogenase E1 component beta subunit
MAELNLLEAIRYTLRSEMRRDASVVILGEDVGPKGGVFLATDGLYAEFGEERVIDTPLAESSIVGLAIGMSLNGLTPVAEIQFADFIHPAFNQIVNEAALFRYRTAGDWNVPIVIRAPYGGGVRGALYHSQSVERYFQRPGLTVVIPSNPYDAVGLLRAAIRDPDPVLFFEHKKMYRMQRQYVPDEDYIVPLGVANVVRQGEDITVFGWGLMIAYALQVADQLDEEGISLQVVDLRTVYPLDRECILNCAKKTGKVAVISEDNLSGGLANEVVALIAEHAFEYLDAPIMRITGPDIPAMPYAPAMEEFFMPAPAKIAERLRKLAAY